MSEPEDTADEAASKTDWEQWQVGRERIDRWLRGGHGVHDQRIGTQKDGKAIIISPPSKGELGDTEIEEIGEAALTDYTTKNQASPEVYAARRFATRNATKQRRGGVAELHEAVAVDRQDAGKAEARAELGRIAKAPQVTISIRGEICTVPLTPEQLTKKTLIDDLGDLAARVQLAADQSGDPQLAQIADVLWVTHGGRSEKMASAFAAIARKAKHHLDTSNSGRRTRAQEADGLLGLLRAEMARGSTRASVAERVIRHMRVSPQLSRGTRIPLTGPLDEALRLAPDVEAAIASAETPKEQMRAVLRVLGAANVNAALDHQRKAESRKKKKADR